jgi:peptide/nickel transport system substrate-binding protein
MSKFGLMMIALVLLASCSPASTGTSASKDTSAPRAGRTLIMVAGVEEQSFPRKPLRSTAGTTFGGGVANQFLNATLAYHDESGRPQLYLAEALPELNTASWRVFADGTMETTYSLKPNLIWHDGALLTADDFVFAWRVYGTSDFGVSTSGAMRLIDEVATADSRTVVIRWKGGYPLAGEIEGDLPPLPRHILEQPLAEADPSAFVNLPFWTDEYVGLGPYRLAAREPGISLEVVAFDAHALGRAKIDRIRLLYMHDANTVVANLLAGAAHYVVEGMIWGPEGALLEREWVAQGKGNVLWEPLSGRAIVIQMRPEFAVPTQLATDVRVRRALAHAIDRAAAFGPVTEGKGLMSDIHTHPYEDYYDLIDRSVAKYPYDPRRAEQLFNEAGFSRGNDGFLAGPNGERFTLQAWYFSNPTNLRENQIFVDSLRTAGVDATTHEWAAINTNNEERSKLPGIFTGSGGSLLTYRGPPTSPDNRWARGNRGGYSNPEFDRLANAYDVTLDRSQRIQQIVQMEQIIQNDLPAIFQYNTPRVVAHAAPLRGPIARRIPTAGWVHNIHLWEWAA